MVGVPIIRVPIIGIHIIGEQSKWTLQRHLGIIGATATAVAQGLQIAIGN